MPNFEPMTVGDIDGRRVVVFDIETDRHGTNVALGIHDVSVESMAEMALNLMHQGERISVTCYGVKYTFGVRRIYIPTIGDDVWILADNMEATSE